MVNYGSKDLVLNLVTILVKLDLTSQFQKLKFSLISLIGINFLKNSVQDVKILSLLRKRRKISQQLAQELVDGVVIMPYRLNRLETLIELIRTFLSKSYKILSESILENKKTSFSIAAFLLLYNYRTELRLLLRDLLYFIKSNSKK